MEGKWEGSTQLPKEPPRRRGTRGVPPGKRRAPPLCRREFAPGLRCKKLSYFACLGLTALPEALPRTSPLITSLSLLSTPGGMLSCHPILSPRAQVLSLRHTLRRPIRSPTQHTASRRLELGPAVFRPHSAWRNLCSSFHGHG